MGELRTETAWFVFLWVPAYTHRHSGAYRTVNSSRTPTVIPADALPVIRAAYTHRRSRVHAPSFPRTRESRDIKTTVNPVPPDHPSPLSWKRRALFFSGFPRARTVIPGISTVIPRVHTPSFPRTRSPSFQRHKNNVVNPRTRARPFPRFAIVETAETLFFNLLTRVPRE